MGVELGLFSVLTSQPSLSVAELAQRCDAEPLLVLRLMRILAAIGFIDELSEGTYSANAVSKQMTKPSTRAGIIHW
jgi:DNA-binding IclR family transcriptional regulator